MNKQEYIVPHMEEYLVEMQAILSASDPASLIMDLPIEDYEGEYIP